MREGEKEGGWEDGSVEGREDYGREEKGGGSYIHQYIVLSHIKNIKLGQQNVSRLLNSTILIHAFSLTITGREELTKSTGSL